MISHREAQELHECIGAAFEEVNDNWPASVLVGYLERARELAAYLERARELAAIVVSDTENERTGNADY